MRWRRQLLCKVTTAACPPRSRDCPPQARRFRNGLSQRRPDRGCCAQWPRRLGGRS